MSERKDSDRMRPGVAWAIASVFWMPFVLMSIVGIVGIIVNGDSSHE